MASVLKRGSKGAAVSDLQRRLISLGFPLPKYGPDGDFGDETQQAIGKALDEIESLRGIKPPEAAEPVPAPTRGGSIDRLLHHIKHFGLDRFLRIQESVGVVCGEWRRCGGHDRAYGSDRGGCKVGG